MKKKYCRYAIYDIVSGNVLICGEKYKSNQNLEFVESFRCFKSRFKKVSAFVRHTQIKGLSVDIVYWFNTPLNTPFRAISDTGLDLGLR